MLNSGWVSSVFELIKNNLGFGALFTVLASGLFVAIRIYMRNSQEVRLQRLSRIDDVNKSYIDFQRLCLENMDAPASVYNANSSSISSLTESQVAKLHLMFDILTSIFERAYLAVAKEGPEDQKQSQWPGWELFMKEYAAREDYRRWWDSNVAPKPANSAPQYDAGFQGFMDDLIGKFRKSSAGTASSGVYAKMLQFARLAPR